MNQGDRLYYFDARSLGLGGNSIVVENSLNPATAGLVTHPYLFGSGYLFIGAEKRGLRVYDGYGNNIGISTISYSRTSMLDFVPAGLVLPFRIARFGIRYYRLWDYSYYYHYDYRDDFYQIIKTVENEYWGALNSIAPVFALNYKSINIGIEQNFIFGKIKKELKTLLPNDPDTIITSTNDFSGRNTKIGFLFAPSIHFRLAYYYSPAYDVLNRTKTLCYPQVHSFGVYYQPPHRVPTKFVAEISYEIWDKPLLIYKFGVEHTILYYYSFRYGFCLFPDYRQTAVWTNNLTLGFGTELKNYYFDIGFGYGTRNYANTEFGGLDIGDKYIFNENQTHFLISFGFKL